MKKKLKKLEKRVDAIAKEVVTLKNKVNDPLVNIDFNKLSFEDAHKQAYESICKHYGITDTEVKGITFNQEPKEESVEIRYPKGWYRATEEGNLALLYFDGNDFLYGFNYKGEWEDEAHVCQDRKYKVIEEGTVILERESVIEQRLIEEAKRRGFNAGYESGNYRYLINGKDFYFDKEKTTLYVRQKSDAFNLILENGKWAKVIEEKPIEEEQKTVRISDLPVRNIEELHAEHKEANVGSEIWKDVIGYEGLYQVSSNGDIRNIKDIKNTTILKPSLETRPNKEQSLKVTLYDSDGASKTFQLKKLVFCAFSKADINKRQNIYHIDKNPLNCNYSNLFTGDDFSNIRKYYFKDKQEAKREPKVGDVVKAWDNDKSKFVYGILDDIEIKTEYPYLVCYQWSKNAEKVTEININDFKREEN